MLTPQQQQDTVTHAPTIPRGADPSTIEALVDSRIEVHIRRYDSERQQRDAEQRRADVKQRMMTYGVGGVVGLATGVGVTLLTQRLRRGRPGSMKP